MKGEKPMAEIKKTEPVKATVKATPVKPVATVAAPVVKEPEKKEEVKAEAKAAVKETVKKETKAPAKKAVAKKAPAKKAAKTEEKPAAKKTAKKAAKRVINLQFAGKSYSVEDLEKIAEDVWKYDLHKENEGYESLELYVKPEESIAYYVFNGEISGSFFI